MRRISKTILLYEIELRFKVGKEVSCKHMSLVQSVPISSCHCSLGLFSGGEFQEEITGSGKEGEREGEEGKGGGEGEEEEGKGGGEGEEGKQGVCGQTKQRMSYSEAQFEEDKLEFLTL